MEIWKRNLIILFIGTLFTSASFSMVPAINGLVVEFTTEDYRGRAFGLNQTANQIGRMLGPMVGGFIGGILPIPFVFIMTGILLLTATSIAYVIRRKYTVINEPG